MGSLEFARDECAAKLKAAQAELKKHEKVERRFADVSLKGCLDRVQAFKEVEAAFAFLKTKSPAAEDQEEEAEAHAHASPPSAKKEQPYVVLNADSARCSSGDFAIPYDC